MTSYTEHSAYQYFSIEIQLIAEKTLNMEVLLCIFAKVNNVPECHKSYLSKDNRLRLLISFR